MKIIIVGGVAGGASCEARDFVTGATTTTLAGLGDVKLASGARPTSFAKARA